MVDDVAGNSWQDQTNMRAGRRSDRERSAGSALIPVWYQRKLKLKAKFETGPPYLSFKSIDPGAFNVGLIGSTCTALPCDTGSRPSPAPARRPPPPESLSPITRPSMNFLLLLRAYVRALSLKVNLAPIRVGVAVLTVRAGLLKSVLPETHLTHCWPNPKR